jgi:hypothetical protein
MSEWNLDEWQGKSKEQVDYSTKVASLCLIIVGILLIVLGVFYLVNKII